MSKTFRIYGYTSPLKTSGMLEEQAKNTNLPERVKKERDTQINALSLLKPYGNMDGVHLSIMFLKQQKMKNSLGN